MELYKKSVTCRYKIHPPLDKVRKKSSEFQEKTHEVDFASSPFHNMKRSIDWYPSNELFFIRSWTLNSSSIAKKQYYFIEGWVYFKLTYIGLPCCKGMLDATDRLPEHGANEQWTNHDPPTKWPSCCGLTRSLAKAWNTKKNLS